MIKAPVRSFQAGVFAVRFKGIGAAPISGYTKRMRRLATLFLVLVFACSGMIGTAAHAAMASAAMPSGDAAPHHGCHESAASEAPFHDQAHEAKKADHGPHGPGHTCPDDCPGGVLCKSCVSAPAILTALQPSGLAGFTLPRRLAPETAGHAHNLAVEPPPPRA